MGKRARKPKAEKKEPEGLKNTVQIRLYPTRVQARMLREHCQEYIDCVNTIVTAHDADMLLSGFSTKDFTAPLPSAVKNQVIRDARSVYNRSFELGRIPRLKKPFVQWNNQNWKIESTGTRSTKKGTTRKSRGASAQKNNRNQNSWTFYQLTQFIIYKAAQLGIKVEMVDPAYTSKECPACKHCNEADDRVYKYRECGWKGHRDMVSAINISRRAGLDGHSQGAMGA